VPAIPLPTLLFFEGSGLAPEKLVRVTIGGRRRRQDLVLEKDQLASLSHIYIATGRAAFRKPWRVAVDDDADLDLGRRNAQGLTTIEIVTKDASE
jgi:hypothetical protein